VKQSNQFVDAPNVIGDARFHRWRHAERLINPAEIVVHVMERDRRFQVLNVFENPFVRRVIGAFFP
jgi:hypothetical protein